MATDGGRVLLVADLHVARCELVQWLEPRFGTVASAADVGEACAWIHGGVLLDLAIVQLQTSDEHRSVMRQLASQRPAVPVIVLSVDDDGALGAMRDGGCRVVRHGDGFELLAAHVERAAPARFAAAVAHVAEGLSPTEARLLFSFAQGARAADVAAELGITTATVQTHRRSMRHKLGAAPDEVLARLRRAYPLLGGSGVALR